MFPKTRNHFIYLCVAMKLSKGCCCANDAKELESVRLNNTCVISLKLWLAPYRIYRSTETEFAVV